jgi:hypothetical protein
VPISKNRSFVTGIKRPETSQYPKGLRDVELPSPGIVLGLGAGSPIGDTEGTWQLTATIDPSLGQPASCVVAAQPTHDEVLAP